MNAEPDPHSSVPGPPVELPIDGVLDLHTFRPQDVRDLVNDYLDECRRRGVWRVRVIHGKGMGALRATVHALLARRADVASYALASEPFGGWGATIVHLKPSDHQGPAAPDPPPTDPH
jgi:DNA-nicking Smr family endonuclease